MILQDGSAHKMTFRTLGDKGTKMCLLCRNAFGSGTNLVQEHCGGMFRANIIYEHEMDLATNDDLKGAVRRLNAYKLTDRAEAFKMRQRSIGFTWHPYNLLAGPELANIIHPVDQFCHDWMHCLVASGLFHLVFHLLLESLETAGVKAAYRLFGKYVGTYSWPAGKGFSEAENLFSESRRDSHRKAGHFKCQASTVRSLFQGVCGFHTSVIAAQT